MTMYLAQAGLLTALCFHSCASLAASCPIDPNPLHTLAWYASKENKERAPTVSSSPIAGQLRPHAFAGFQMVPHDISVTNNRLPFDVQEPAAARKLPIVTSTASIVYEPVFEGHSTCEIKDKDGNRWHILSDVHGVLSYVRVDQTSRINGDPFVN
jgi:hypothetical protein